MKRYSLGIVIGVIAFFIGFTSYLLIIQVGNTKKIEPVSVNFKDNTKQEKQSPQKIDEESAEKLCNRLSEMKHLPYKSQDGDGIYDEVYDSLIKAGDAVIPCLIDKITDTTEMQDPRETSMAGLRFAVGDLAYFMFVRIAKIDFTEMLPDKVKESYKTEGVYAFHDFVADKKNRIYLQQKMDDWYCEKFNIYGTFKDLSENYKEADFVVLVKIKNAKFLSDPDYQEIVYNTLDAEVIESFKGNFQKGTHIEFIVEDNKKTSLESYKGERIYFLTRLIRNTEDEKYVDEEERKLKLAQTEFTGWAGGEPKIQKLRRIKARFNIKSKIQNRNVLSSYSKKMASAGV